MKKILALLSAVCLVLTLCACGTGENVPAAETPPAETPAAETPAAEVPSDEPSAEASSEEPAEETAPDYSGYTIRIYSNSNPAERTEWLIGEAAAAGFTVSIDDNSVVSGDIDALQYAEKNGDGDLIFGLNEKRWGEIVNGGYDTLSLIEWTPSWEDAVGEFRFDSLAYGLVTQNVLMLYRTDELGTDGKTLHFTHWADVVDCGYTWYRPNRISGSTNANICAAILYPFTEPDSPAGGISTDGWKTLWRFFSEGISGGDEFNYGFDPLNRGDAAVSEFYSAALYGKINAASEGSEHPLIGAQEPENWDIVDIDDGAYYTTEYIGILDKPGRTEEQTEAVKAFCDWFGSAETQAAWAEAFDTFPCNTEAAALLYGGDIPAIYQLPNLALTEVPGVDMNYAAYAAAHADEWTNIITNLGFCRSDGSTASEPDWDELDWDELVLAKE